MLDRRLTTKTHFFWVCAVADHFGNEKIVFSGGKRGEEEITLEHEQTILLRWSNEGLNFYDQSNETDIEVHPSARFSYT